MQWSSFRYWFCLQTIDDKSIKFGSLPTALRKVMVSKFPEFDEYQLAKYNKEKKNPDNKKKAKLEAERPVTRTRNEASGQV